MQSGLSENVQKEKEYAAFDQAIKDLEAYWTESLFDDFKISLKGIYCGNNNLVWSDFDRMKEYYKSPIRNLSQYNDIAKEASEMHRHIN